MFDRRAQMAALLTLAGVCSADSDTSLPTIDRESLVRERTTTAGEEPGSRVESAALDSGPPSANTDYKALYEDLIRLDSPERSEDAGYLVALHPPSRPISVNISFSRESGESTELSLPSLQPSQGDPESKK